MKLTGLRAQNGAVFPMRPFRTRQQLTLAAGGAVLLLIALVAILYFTILPTSAPRKLAISATTSASASASPVASGQATGSWSIAKNSVAGYRVREQLASIGAPSDAVGRTSSITGGLTLSNTGNGYSVDAGTFTVDVTTLTSDRAQRDQRIHSIGLQSDRYPTASFKLTSPIALPGTASNGQIVQVSAVGDLTIHGTTHNVTIPMTAKLSSGQIEVAGALTFPFSQFGMTPPNIGNFVTVQNNATMEFLLYFQRAGGQ